MVASRAHVCHAGRGCDVARSTARSTRQRGSVCGLVLIFVLAACGGGTATSPTADKSARPRVLEVAGSQPSLSARMICADEGAREIAATVGTETVRPRVGRWHEHLYSCDYAYRDGRVMALSVKELSSAAETIAYFDALGRRLGRMRSLQGLGQDAYQTSNGATVVRKDYRVLLVDVSRLPAQFGTPSSPRADVSLSVAATIMGCWTGA